MNVNNKDAESLEGLIKIYFEQLFKNANLLMVAHAGVLVACLATMKEYSLLPHLRGVGLIIAAECMGMFTAALSYAAVSIAYLHDAATGLVEMPREIPVPRIIYAALVAQLMSLLTFLFSILTVALKLYPL